MQKVTPLSEGRAHQQGTLLSLSWRFFLTLSLRHSSHSSLVIFSYTPTTVFDVGGLSSLAFLFGGFSNVMVVRSFSLLHCATLRQWAINAGFLLQSIRVISSLMMLFVVGCANSGKILASCDRGHSATMWKADCSSAPHVRVKLRVNRPLRKTISFIWPVHSFYTHIFVL